jgi:very-short-patch-repair endonuclease
LDIKEIGYTINNSNMNISHPDISKQWHPTKNGKLKIIDFTSGSAKKVWWLCDKTCSNGCKHEWETEIRRRLISGCHFCSKQKCCIHESIVFTNKELIKQWHPTKNEELKPEDFRKGSSKKVWWLCDKICLQGCKHEWDASISDRSKSDNSTGCPYCSKNKWCIHESIIYSHPEISKEWHPTKNDDLLPDNFKYGSNKKIWWLCSIKCSHGCKHEYQDSICSRTIKGTGCSPQPHCIHSSIIYTHPNISKQWHPTKNEDLLPSDFKSGSQKEVWWICNNTCNNGCLHEWKTTIAHRCIDERGCPFCSKPPKQFCKHISLLHTHPEIANEWHPTKNSDLLPDKVTSGCGKEVWWLCNNKCSYGCLHEYQSIIGNRTKHKTGCTYCSKPPKEHCIHSSILYTHKEEVKQWHPKKNKQLNLSDFTFASDMKVWWICMNDIKHEWESQIKSICRNGHGCPHCKNKTEKKLYDYLLNIYPDIIGQFKLDSCKNKFKLPFDFCIPSIKVIIELDGRQHFIQVSNWNTPDETIKRDIFKIKKAVDSGYKVIRIFQEDVYNSDETWLEEELLPKIISLDKTTIFISKDKTLYNKHIELLENNIDIELTNFNEIDL